MPNVARNSTVPAQAHNDDVLAEMYAARQAEDSTKNRADVYARNPDALQLYSKGVFDILTSVEVFLDEGMDTDTLQGLLKQMKEQAGTLANAKRGASRH